MAATATPALIRRAGAFARAVIGWLALAVGLFFLVGWIGSSIPRGASAESSENAAAGIEVMVESNGVHTQLVLPVVTAGKDWRTVFPSAADRVRGRATTHIAVGWGDREVFLHNPSWSDLTAPSVMRIATVGGPGVIRVSNLSDPPLHRHRRRLMLSPAQYQRLAERIEGELTPATRRRAHRGHLPHQSFYDAAGDYTLGNTCNQWTGNMLAHAGVETGRWTPFAGGVMKWVPRADTAH